MTLYPKAPDLLFTAADPGALATGESTLPRDKVNFGQAAGSVGAGSQSLRFTLFTAKKSETISQVKVVTGTTAAGATPTLVRIGVYRVSASGLYTLVASTANDTTLLAASGTAYTKALSASFTKIASLRYAIGVLWVTAAATPTLAGVNGSTETLVPPVLGQRLDGQSDLPASCTPTGTAAGLFYAALLP